MFTISDDAHSIDQVGDRYPELIQYLDKAQIQEVVCMKGSAEYDGHLMSHCREHFSLEQLEKHLSLHYQELEG